MKIFRLFLVVLASIYTGACSKPADTKAQLETLKGIEERLARIEEHLETNKIQVYLTGAVANPGQYSVSKDISVLAALAVAGGNKRTANLRKVTISRKDMAEDILAEKDALKNITLENGDVVVIPERIF